jgi:hypothetical protein
MSDHRTSRLSGGSASPGVTPASPLQYQKELPGALRFGWPDTDIARLRDERFTADEASR